MATGRITKSSVDATTSGAKDTMLWDDKLSGFGLKVTPTGSKVYVFQYRLGGRGAKVRRYTIGPHGKFTPDGARKEAERLAMLAARGVDPQSEKVERVRRSVDLAFKPYAERFAEECLRVKWPSSHKYARSLLLSHAVPVLGNKPLPDIRRQDMRAVLAPVKDKPATAQNLFSVMRRLFRWAVNEGDLEASPIEGMEPPSGPPSRDRVLSDRELALVWRAAEGLGYPFGPMVRLLIVTGARREEVAGLSWSELDRGSAMWSLPSARSKNDLPAATPLSALAVAELDGLAARTGESDQWPRKGLVFSTTGETSVSGYSRAKRRLDALIAKLAAKEDEPITVEPWRFHDLRRTLATGLQRLGVRFEVTEAVLNHVGGSRAGVAGIYQRHDWAAEKRTALNAWSNHVAAILKPAKKSNVVQLASARA
jgi:integrase